MVAAVDLGHVLKYICKLYNHSIQYKPNIFQQYKALKNKKSIIKNINNNYNRDYIVNFSSRFYCLYNFSNIIMFYVSYTVLPYMVASALIEIGIPFTLYNLLTREIFISIETSLQK